MIYWLSGLVVVGLIVATRLSLVSASCRTQPGDADWPTHAQWEALNKQLGGRLVPVVPSAQACRRLQCTEAQWLSGLFRADIPGSMNAVSFPSFPLFISAY